MTAAPRGTAAVEAAFARARSTRRTAIVAYLTAGYPDRDASVACVESAIDAGADVIELGVPFSDPIADGPVIQAASDAALRAGMTLRGALGIVRELRTRRDTPILLMTYYNSVLSPGLEATLDAVREAGVDGLIIPDLIPDEAASIEREAQRRGLALVFLAAPNAGPDRLREVASHTTGFLYVVGLEGVTGERAQLAEGVADLLGRVRASVEEAGRPGLAIAIGFGISKPEHVRQLGPHADGVIVGTAVVRRMMEGPASVGGFLKTLKEAS